MKLYKIAGFVANGAYKETVLVLEPMEEKEKCYIGCGKRIDKEKIDQITEGIFNDVYEMYVVDEEKIDFARSTVYETCLSLSKKRFEQARDDFTGAEKFVLGVPTIKAYGKGEV